MTKSIPESRKEYKSIAQMEKAVLLCAVGTREMLTNVLIFYLVFEHFENGVLKAVRAAERSMKVWIKSR